MAKRINIVIGTNDEQKLKKLFDLEVKLGHWNENQIEEYRKHLLYEAYDSYLISKISKLKLEIKTREDSLSNLGEFDFKKFSDSLVDEMMDTFSNLNEEKQAEKKVDDSKKKSSQKYMKDGKIIN